MKVSANGISRNSGQVCVAGSRRLVERSIHDDTGGCFMEPALITGVTPDDRVVRAEIFGPVLSVILFDTEEQTLKLTDDSIYGLASAVWTSNLSRPHRMIGGLRGGVVHVNTYGGADNTVPPGGRQAIGRRPRQVAACLRQISRPQDRADQAMNEKTILIVGTCDTKQDELEYIAGVIRAQAGKVLIMNVSVLGDPADRKDFSRHQVVEAAGSSIAQALAYGDETLRCRIWRRAHPCWLRVCSMRAALTG